MPAMSRLFLLVAAFVVALDLFNGAVLPLGLPAWLEQLAGFALGVGAARFLAATATDRPAADPGAADRSSHS